MNIPRSSFIFLSAIYVAVRTWNGTENDSRQPQFFLKTKIPLCIAKVFYFSWRVMCFKNKRERNKDPIHLPRRWLMNRTLFTVQKWKDKAQNYTLDKQTQNKYL